MNKNNLFQKLRDGKVVLGLSNSYPASGIIDGMCPGWDFVWIDGQHGQHSYESIFHAVQAASSVSVDALIRVYTHESGNLCLYADLFPAAIMVPMVNSAAEARAVVNGLYFPPLGNRSYGGRRIIDMNGREYYKETELLVVAQIETLEAVDNAYDIINTEGVAALFFGPDDMKVRKGISINTSISESKELREAMEVTAQAAKKAGKFCGIVAANRKDFATAVNMGYQLIAVGGDSGFVRAGASERLKEFRNEITEGAKIKVESGKNSINSIY